MAKTKAQVEKQKRATEKRKKVEKAVLRMAAGMPDDAIEQESTVPDTNAKADRNKPELCLVVKGMPAYSLDRMKEMIPLVRKGRLDEAEILAYAGLKESPDCPSYWDVLADIEEARGDKDESSRLREVGIQALRHLSEKAGESPSRDALEGWTLWRAERFEEAIQALRRLEPFVEGDTAAFFQLLIGSSCVMAKRLREGRIALERAVSGSSNTYVVDEACKGLIIIANMRHGIAQILEGNGISFDELMKLDDMQGEEGAEVREIWEVGDLLMGLSGLPKEDVRSSQVTDAELVCGPPIPGANTYQDQQIGEGQREEGAASRPPNAQVDNPLSSPIPQIHQRDTATPRENPDLECAVNWANQRVKAKIEAEFQSGKRKRLPPHK